MKPSAPRIAPQFCLEELERRLYRTLRREVAASEGVWQQPAAGVDLTRRAGRIFAELSNFRGRLIVREVVPDNAGRFRLRRTPTPGLVGGGGEE